MYLRNGIVFDVAEHIKFETSVHIVHVFRNSNIFLKITFACSL